MRYADRGDLFEGLKIWENEEYREVQGTYPVISLSFASVKEQTYEQAKQRICRLIAEEYTRNQFLLESDFLTDQDKRFFLNINADISEETATFALHKLADFLFRYYNKRVIILLDEYDTPMQEAYVDGYWDELVAFTRSLFNATFKTNPWLERGIMTGITRVSCESIFSDLNHLKLALTNYEVERMFDDMVHNWFEEVQPDYNDFIKAMLQDDVDAMNEYMNRVALGTFSYFDTGKGYGGEEPERFYHGFVLGLVVDMQNRYFVASNRESGFGRYDVILEPKNPKVDDAFILEFKAFNRRKEQSLGDTLQSALEQIEEKQYAAQLVERGIPAEHIHSYGFAFQGKTVLIG